MDREIAIVMCYTGWSKEDAETAIELWRLYISRWSAEYMERSLSSRDLKRLEELTCS